MQDWKSHMRWIDVEDGDVVFGMSDGVHEFLPEEMLAALFKKRLSPDVFHKAVCDLIKTSPVAEDEPRNNPTRKKRFDASCPRHSDDVSTFVVTI